MRGLNSFRFSSVSNSVALRVLTALVIILAPAAAYAAKCPCTSAQSASNSGVPSCLNGSYNGLMVTKYQYFMCAGTSENDDCTPDLVPNRLIQRILQYTTVQSQTQASAQDSDAESISQAFADCNGWAQGLAGVALGVTIVGGVTMVVGTVARWFFPAVGAAAEVIGAVVTIAGEVASYNVNATLAQCQQQCIQQMARHQERINSCYYVSRSEAVEISTQRADSCQW
jgi:hypothetical protein